MKKIFVLWIGILSVLCFAACDDNHEQFYSGEPSLYLDLSDSQLDSMMCSFMTTSENQIRVELPVVLAGYAVADQDRVFRLKIDEGITTAVAGKHYQALQEQYVLPKGEYQVKVPVTFLFDHELVSVAVRLALSLEISEDFVPGIPYRQKVLIISSNVLPFISAENWTSRYSSYFGPYSKTKHRYILSELKLHETVNFEDVTAWSRLPVNLRSAYGMEMNNFFREHHILDENNQLIEPWIK